MNGMSMLILLFLAFSGWDVGSILRDLPAPGGSTPTAEVQVFPSDPETKSPSQDLLDFGSLETAEVSFHPEEKAAGTAGSTEPMRVALHRMESAAGAFGIFASQRGDAEEAGIGSGSFVAEERLVFWKGPYFATIGGGDDEARVLLGRELAERIPASQDSFPALERMPTGNRVRNSERYLPSGRSFLGIDGLEDAWVASYRDGQRHYSLLLRRNRPPIKPAAFEGKGTVKANPNAKNPVQLVEMNDGTTLLLFYARMSPWLAVYHGPKPDPDAAGDLSAWVESLRPAPSEQ